MVHVRRAEETDRNNVALCIAEGFEKDFSVLCKDSPKVANAIAAGLNIEKFYIADISGDIAGTLDYPATTGYIEFVAVRKTYRKQGVATAMLRESMLLTDYQDFVLDVTDVNNNAIQCYTNIGFEEFKRVPEKNGKQKGFNERIYMQYRRDSSRLFVKAKD